FRSARTDDTDQVVELQSCWTSALKQARVPGRNKQTEEVAFVGLLVEVTTIRVACPDEPNNLIYDFIYGHLRLVSCRAAWSVPQARTGPDRARSRKVNIAGLSRAYSP